ncbi:MAG TPA: hypothetical protein DIC36_09865 [Gammaproteobacteria bacterium]|nr:hypothetical protein [Gammaproteobacteria bacterium]
MTEQWLIVQFVSEKTGSWETLTTAALRPSAEMHPEDPSPNPDTYEISQPVILPNGEAYSVGVIYAARSMGINMVVFKDDEHWRTIGGNKDWLNLGGFKNGETTYNPSLLFHSDTGIPVQVMVGPKPDFRPGGREKKSVSVQAGTEA